jgi:hypothetical protein
MQTGWYRQVQIKSPHSHAIRGLLNSRALLIKIQRDLETMMRRPVAYRGENSETGGNVRRACIWARN